MSRCPERIAGSRARAARDRSGGFTLVEALVAFVVLAMILAVLFRGVVGLRAGAAAYDRRAHADLVAQAVLEETLARRGSESGPRDGWRDGRHWTMRMTPIGLAAQLPDPPTDADVTDKTRLWAPQRVVISVETGGQPVEVETIRLVRAP